MGLAASQARLLTLTARKSDVEYGISMNALEKMSLTRQMSKLTNEYNMKMNSKKLMYCNNGEYHKLTYQYLMGSTNKSAMGASPTGEKATIAVRDNLDMILTDCKGRVVINDAYAKRFKMAGLNVDEYGRGETFGPDKIIDVMLAMCGKSDDNYRDIFEYFINGGEVNSMTYTAKVKNAITGLDVEDAKGAAKTTTGDNTATKLAIIKKYFDLYYPIVLAAANNGWTTEYNKEMAMNEDYIADSLISGSFQLALVDDDGGYNPDTTLTYFTTSGNVVERTDTATREKITAWYDAERSIIAEKENFVDLEQTDLSTELETIKTEIESIKSFINDAVTTVFNWGTNG